MILVLAIGISACISMPVAGVVGAALWIRSFRQGRRLDRDSTRQPTDPVAVFAIDSAGRAYEAVAVKDCDTCGQALPTDHRCTAGVA